MALEEIDFKNGETPASAETMKAFQANIKNEFERIEPVILYESENGSTGNITLGESVENFEYIEIFYKDISSVRNAVDSVKIENANGKYVNAKTFGPVPGSGNELRYAVTTFRINNTTIVAIDYLCGYITNSNFQYYGSQELAITKVIGYR